MCFQRSASPAISVSRQPAVATTTKAWPTTGAATVPAAAIVKSWVKGAIQNLASPVIAIDPRVRQLNEKSFYNSKGKSIFEKALNFIADNNPTFVIILLIGLLISLIFSVAQLCGFFLLIKRHGCNLR